MNGEPLSPTEQNPSKPVDTFMYTLDASRYWAYYKHFRYRKPPEYPTELMERGAELLAQNPLDPGIEGEWDHIGLSQNPENAKVFVHMFSWRAKTIQIDAVECLSASPLEEDQALAKEIAQIPWDKLLFVDFKKIFGEDFNLVSYYLIQARREELIQGLTVELLIPPMSQEGFDCEALFKQRVFQNIYEIDRFMDIVDNTASPHNLEAIQQNLFQGGESKDAATAFQLFMYLKEVTGGTSIEETSRAIAAQILVDYEETLKKQQPESYPTREIVEKILPRLGIPTHEIFYQQEQIPPDAVTKLAPFIGKFLADMNSTHLRE